MTEEWRPVVGYEGLYEVSDHGRVRSLDRTVVRHDGFTQSYAGRMISIHPTKANRRAVGLYKNDKHSRRQVYTLVLEAFVGPRPEGMDACHNDGDSANDAQQNGRPFDFVAAADRHYAAILATSGQAA